MTADGCAMAAAPEIDSGTVRTLRSIYTGAWGSVSSRLTEEQSGDISADLSVDAQGTGRDPVGNTDGE